MIVTRIFEARHWFAKYHSLNTGADKWWLGCGYEPDFVLNAAIFICPIHCEYDFTLQIGCFWIRGGYYK